MKFVRLTLNILIKLRLQGYNILRSNSLMTEENPTWIPDKVDLEKFFDLDSDELGKYIVPMAELHLLPIDEGLTLTDDQLIGDVLIEGD